LRFARRTFPASFSLARTGKLDYTGYEISREVSVVAEKRRISEDEAMIWYNENRGLYQDFSVRVHELLERLLDGGSMAYQSITHRVKEKESFRKKYAKKEYSSPEEMTDMAGVRIIAYTTSDVEKICKLIKQDFAIDQKNSGNKAKDMRSNEVGYLSVHYVASLSDPRKQLGEYKRYQNLKCEIQVRTLLQHAWAEIEHDRNYKFGGELPEAIKRKFYLVAGTLELMDQQFQTLSDEIVAYGRRVAKETKKGELDIPIDSISVGEFLRQKFPELPLPESQTTVDSMLILELQAMGVQTLADLERLATPDIVAKIVSGNPNPTYPGVLRDIMVFFDLKKYFEKAWNGHWNTIYSDTVDYWRKNGVDVSDFSDKIRVEERT